MSEGEDQSGVRIMHEELPWEEGQGAQPEPWQEAWDYVETQERLQREGRVLELREEQRALIDRGRISLWTSNSRSRKANSAVR